MAQPRCPKTQQEQLFKPEKAKKAAKNDKRAMTTAASQMFAFYANLLSVEVK
jgi:hypothetical protein